MSRILKRPMFRRGGKVNEGIMSGLVDRKQYKLGSMTEDEIRSNIDMLVGLQDQFAPVSKTRLPIGDVGLALVAGQSPIDALATGYKKFTSEDDKRRALLDKRKQAAVSTVLGQALKEKKTTIPTTKAVKNISNQTLFNIPPGGEGFATNAQIIAAQGAFKTPDPRMITLPDGKVLPYEEYKKQNTDESKAKALGTQYNILTGFVEDMQSRLPDTKTFAVGQGFAFVEGLSDQFSQIAEGIGDKGDLNVDDEKFNNYMETKGFTKFASNFATMKGSVINLGYALAKIAEPDNPRLSEGDIIRQLNRINFGSSRKVFSDSLDQILKEEGIRARAEIKGLGFKDADKFFNLGTDEVTKKTELEPGSAVPEFKILSTGEVLIKKDGKFVPYEVK